MKSAKLTHKTITKIALSVLIPSIGLTACKKAPEGVLQREEMAQLMADIHLGEAMIDFNYSSYPNDSTRKLLKQSIYAAHNVSAEEVDTSFVWYGHHIEEYIKVYDRTIEIIEERQRDNNLSSSTQISVAGDSVQVWSGPQRLLVSSRMPSRIVTFNLSPDSTWQKGDVYTLYYKPVNGLSQVKSRLLIDYSDGTTDYVDENSSRQSQNKLKLQADTTLTPIKVYGYLTFTPEANKAFEVDSISLTRVRRELDRTPYFPHTTFSNGLLRENAGTTTENEQEETTETPEPETFGSRNRRHHESTATRRQSSTPTPVLPKSSSETVSQSEHRRDADQHKPTPQQRRDATRRRNASQPATPKRSMSNSPQQANPALTPVPQKSVPNKKK